MKRFAFRLARLERVREIRRSEARAVLAAAAAEAAESRHRCELARAALAGATHRDGPAEPAIDLAALKQLSVWREALRSRLDGAERLERETAARVREAHGHYVEASREHRIIERLGEKRRRRWLQEIETEERRFLDETHLLRIVREGGGESPFGAASRPAPAEAGRPAEEDRQ